MKIVICDDEVIFTQQIVDLIKAQPDYNDYFVIDTFLSGKELLKAVNRGEKYGIIFLDILLRDVNGIDVVEKLKEYDCFFILISSSYSYVTKAFNLQVSQYLIKPIDINAFAETFKNCMEMYKQKQKIISVKIDRLEYSIHLKDILYFESQKRKVKAVNKTGEEFEFYNKLGNLEKLFAFLHLTNMLRVHQSYIVNLDYCTGFVEQNIYLQGEKNIRKIVQISIRKAKDVKSKINLQLISE